MPPKNVKKDPSSGKSSAAQRTKENEKVSIEDLLFPRSTIVNLAKECSVQGADVGVADEEQKKVILSKDAVTALQRSATVFVNRLMIYARNVSLYQGRKSCNVDDILEALRHCGLEGLTGLVRERLDEYQHALEMRKLEKKEGVAKETGTLQKEPTDNEIETVEQEAAQDEPIDGAETEPESTKKPRLQQE
ncbi:LADA_0F03070g1_1 [Lachancea dasiensis]|uniref:DNA polymerase epsilon subunit D n=1 Tax=Lachancea dasiensis TaxID=1072105 RepID=A0A1G4JJE3_9SACH|nr:LADA_0F03070g1_1 [Lachancea dasiensis]